MGLFGSMGGMQSSLPAAMFAAPEASKPKSGRRRRGLFGSSGDFDIGNAILAALGGDPVLAILARRQQQEAAAQQAEAARDAEGRRMEALQGLGFSKDEISALNADDASQSVRERRAPFTLAPGSERHTPGIGGAQSQVYRAQSEPTNAQRTYEWLMTVDPELARSYAAREALIINSGIDPATGQPYTQAVDPRTLFDFGGGGVRPQSQGAPLTDDDIRRMEQQGGASPSSGSRPFR